MGVGFMVEGCTYAGIEVDAASVEFARKKGLDVHQSPVEKADDSPIAGRKFDVVLSANVFEHVTEPLRGFSAVSSLCAGLVIVMVPNAHGFSSRMKAFAPFRRLVQAYNKETRELAYAIDGYWHNISYTRHTLIYLARQSSIDVIELCGMTCNDRTFGFVQPSNDPIYRLFAVAASMIGMPSGLVLIGRTWD